MHYLQGFDCIVDVVRNDQIDFETVTDYDKIVLSPGPGIPSEAEGMMRIIKEFIHTKPIFGVCLGFQALTEYFGGSLYNQNNVKHGISEYCTFDTKSRLFQELPERFKVGLYHSWAANESDFPSELKITARSENNVIMAFEHLSLPVCGVQFHPESILTEHGKDIVENFILNFI